MSRQLPARRPDWGELGPAMKALNEQQREFVYHYVSAPPKKGTLVEATGKLATARARRRQSRRRVRGDCPMTNVCLRRSPKRPKKYSGRIPRSRKRM